MKKPLFLALIAISTFAPLWLAHAAADPAIAKKIDAGVWSAARAMKDISTQISFGPRAPDTPGHEATLQYIEKEMHKTKIAEVKAQQWVDAHQGGFVQNSAGNPNSGHSMANIVVRFYPDNPRRIIVGTHYDSIIRAYRDKDHPNATMPGANNSASGVALLLETARAMSKLPPPPVGVDFVFFDGEEGPLALGEGDHNWRPLGSPYFAEHLADFYPDAKPEQAIVFDMVCYKKLRLMPEPLSYSYASKQTDAFWDIGVRRAPTIFNKARTQPIEDDHIALGLHGVPSFLVIGFEYMPYYNTTQDTIDKCSETSLKAVGDTLLEHIYAQ